MASIGSQKHHNIEYIQIFLQFVIQIVVLSFLKIFFKLKIQGREKVALKLKELRKEEKGVLFAPNHISELDVLLVRFALPFIIPIMPMYYVSMTRDHYQDGKFGWRKYFYGGSFFKILGAYSAYLGMRDYQASLINHIELLENGKAVCIFPEGKMGMETYKPGEAKGGVGFLAEYTKTDIIPVQLKGLQNINWFKVFTFQRPIIEVKYREIIDIENVLKTLNTDIKYEQDIERYKKIASITMDKVWE
jgi:1-acyl-sn-glycerol-3-phosphate acyltransferase